MTPLGTALVVAAAAALAAACGGEARSGQQVQDGGTSTGGTVGGSGGESTGGVNRGGAGRGGRTGNGGGAGRVTMGGAAGGGATGRGGVPVDGGTAGTSGSAGGVAGDGGGAGAGGSAGASCDPANAPDACTFCVETHCCQEYSDCTDARCAGTNATGSDGELVCMVSCLTNGIAGLDGGWVSRSDCADLCKGANAVLAATTNAAVTCMTAPAADGTAPQVCSIPCFGGDVL